MYTTDVSELCSAIKNIEKKDLKRVVMRFGGKYTFPVDARPILELWSEGEGPTSAEVAGVRVKDDSVLLDTPELGAEIDSCMAYPGYLSAVTNKIVELEAA